MLLSLAVLLVPIAVIFLGWRFLTGGTDASPIDPRPSYDEASGAGLDVREPSGLGDDWVPISQDVNQSGGAVTLRVGFYTPDEAGAQLIESDGPAKRLIGEELGKAPKETGVLSTKYPDWKTYITVDGNNALVYSTDDLTIIVHGDASVDELGSLARALK
jgi:hypothetical protein